MIRQRYSKTHAYVQPRGHPKNEDGSANPPRNLPNTAGNANGSAREIAEAAVKPNAVKPGATCKLTKKNRGISLTATYKNHDAIDVLTFLGERGRRLALKKRNGKLSALARPTPAKIREPCFSWINHQLIPFKLTLIRICDYTDTPTS